MQWGKIAIGALTVVIVGLGAVWAIKWFWPTAMDARPKLVEVPPLAPISRSSRIIIPAAITLTTLRDAMEQAPRELSGKAEIPLGPSSAEIAWSAVRGGFGVEGGPNGLKLWTQLRGSLRASAQLGALRAFGLLGLAARSAVPYLERTLAENAVIDLVPLAADARKNIEAAIAEFQRTTEGVRVDATVADLRLVGIEFDAKTLRVIAEADGTVRVEVTALPAG
jgi:hypothetical protein